MSEQDKQRLRFCAKVFNAFGVELLVLADHKVKYQVGESWQCDSLDALEYKAEEMLRYRRRLR